MAELRVRNLSPHRGLVQRDLHSLWSRLPSPANLEDSMLSVQHHPADGVDLYHVGLRLPLETGDRVEGGAGEPGSPPVTRAYVECLERVALKRAQRSGGGPFPIRDLEGTQRDVIGRSELFVEPVRSDGWRSCHGSGVAAHPSREHALRHAWLELVERHRILSAWYGSLQPEEHPLRGDVSSWMPPGLNRVFRLRAHRFPAPGRPHAPRVMMLTGSLRSDPSSLWYGFGSGFDTTEALRGALREFIQQFVPDHTGETTEFSAAERPIQPRDHLAYFRSRDGREILRGWLENGHSNLLGSFTPIDPDRLNFADLTPPEWRDSLHVVKAAAPPRVMTLVHGRGHPKIREPIPERMEVHPIG